MKYLLLSLTLIASANAWADDEFPIQLTCEFGTILFYLNLEEKKDESWGMHHESSINISALVKKPSTKKSPLRQLKFNPNTIEIGFGGIGAMKFFINRFNLTISAVGGMGSSNGQCYKGFKEYEKQI